MTSPNSGYLAVPQDEVPELPTMVAPPTVAAMSTTSGGRVSGVWWRRRRSSGVAQLPAILTISDVQRHN